MAVEMQGVHRLDSGFILRGELIGLACGLGVGSDTKRGIGILASGSRHSVSSSVRLFLSLSFPLPSLPLLLVHRIIESGTSHPQLHSCEDLRLEFAASRKLS